MYIKLHAAVSLSAHIIAIQYSTQCVFCCTRKKSSCPFCHLGFWWRLSLSVCLGLAFGRLVGRARQLIKHYEMVCASIEAKYRFIEQHHYHIPNFIAHAEKRIWCLICLSINAKEKEKEKERERCHVDKAKNIYYNSNNNLKSRLSSFMEVCIYLFVCLCSFTVYDLVHCICMCMTANYSYN